MLFFISIVKQEDKKKKMLHQIFPAFSARISLHAMQAGGGGGTCRSPAVHRHLGSEHRQGPAVPGGRPFSPKKAFYNPLSSIVRYLKFLV